MRNGDAESSSERISDRIFQELRVLARTASRHAYCPYSHFPVGAAILTDKGEIYSGCNVENSSLGLTVCAERNAIFHAVAEGARQIRAVVTYTPTSKPSASCGSCRQVINEFCPTAEIFGCAGRKNNP